MQYVKTSIYQRRMMGRIFGVCHIFTPRLPIFRGVNYFSKFRNPVFLMILRQTNSFILWKMRVYSGRQIKRQRIRQNLEINQNEEKFVNAIFF